MTRDRRRQPGATTSAGSWAARHSGVERGDDRRDARIAYFTPERIARTGQALGLTSDARSRFERGVDPAFLDEGLAIADRADPRHLRRRGRRPRSARRATPPIEQPRRIALRLPARDQRRSAAIDVPEDAAARRSWNASASRALKRRAEVTRADLAARHRRPGRPGRGSRAHRRLRPGSLDAARARAGRRQADRDPVAADRAASAPHGRRARPRRGGDLELHLRRRGGGVRRRRLAARQSDQRRHEGDAPVAAAGPDRRRAAQPRPRRVVASGCSRSAAAISATPSIRRSALLLAGERTRARLADRARRRASMLSTPRPRCWRCSRRPARRSRTCRSSRMPGRPGIPGRSATLAAWAQDHRRRVRRAAPEPGRRRSMRRPARSRPKSISTRSRRRAPAGARAPPIAPPALQAVTRDFAFIVPADCPPTALRSRDPRRRQGSDHRGARCSTGSRPRTACRLRVEVTLQPGEKSFTDERDRRDFEADRRRRGEARRAPAELVRAR